MKSNRAIKVASVLLVLTFILSTGASASAPIGAGVGEILSNPYPVYDDDYNTTYVSGPNSWAERYYSTAWWVWDGAEAETRLTCSDAHAVSDQTCYVYARLENKNKTNDVQVDSFTGTPNANRYVVAETPNLDSKKATNIKHTAWLRINGTYQWNTSSNTYELP